MCKLTYRTAHALRIVRALTHVSSRSPHYGTEFRIELVDASRNSSIGAGIITTQTLLLRQRDSFIRKHGLPVLAPFRGPPSLEAQHISLELRSGIKSGAEFYSSSSSLTSSASDKARPGEYPFLRLFYPGQLLSHRYHVRPTQATL